jgi:regulator of RNase E activity RraA
MNERGKPGLRVREKIRRPDTKLIQELAKYPIPNIGDAMSKSGIMDAGIRPAYLPMGRMIGPAVTVKAFPGDHLMAREAMSLLQSGDVLVIDSARDCSKSVWGGFASDMILRRGAAGIVIDGATRDVRDIRKMGCKIFVRGITPLAPSFSGGGEINFPVCCGGVVVGPGDIVVGDEEGVAVVPLDDLETVLELLKHVVEHEAGYRVEVDQGKIVRAEWVHEQLRSQGCSFIS